MKWCELRKYKWNEDVTIAVVIAIEAIAWIKLEKIKLIGASTGFEPVSFLSQVRWIQLIGLLPMYGSS